MISGVIVLDAELQLRAMSPFLRALEFARDRGYTVTARDGKPHITRAR